ncbi:diguanylate cyclase domain-containing protein [Actinoplanes sp. CA-252034]|uniref:diguanylate cyclase domain-containing protein n=1 Tax=Actinoplanes sp. CA-252034 TaxID=3239906 RepID=UPI003D95608C
MVDAGAVGLLSPFVGGTYYGSLVAGVAAAAEFYGRRLIAIQTLDAAADVTLTGGDPEFDDPVAWDHISGFVALADAVHPAYLARLEQAGKPVVLVGHTIAGRDLPAVLSDNGAGIRAVVTHLIREHGCRRFAFTGHLGASDIRERHDAYLDVLASHGLEPGVFLPAHNNVESGVTWDAADLLRHGPPDALIAATDRNAIAALQVLAAGGLNCPDDILVTGFDDIDEARLLRAELASVSQPLDAMGRRAVDLLMRMLDGQDVPSAPHLLPTGFVPRSSCGCVDFAERLPEPGADDDGVRLLATRLAGVVPDGTGVRAAGLTADALTAASAGDTSAIGAAVAELQTLLAGSTDPDALRVACRAIQEYAAEMPVTDATAATRVGGGVQAIVLSLGRDRAHAHLGDKLHLRSLISVNYTLNRALLHRRDVEPQDPSWLGLTPATAGSIALRRTDGRLTRTRGWRRRPGPVIPPGPTTATAFPPAELLDAAEPGETVFVVKAKVGDSDRGWLALVDAVENRVEDGREMVNQCAALLTIALDLRDQQQRLEREAQSDRLTGLPNRSSFVASLEAALARRRTEARPAVVLFLDLDGFKQVNDSMGHHTGDRLLVCVADRLRHCLRREDVVGRFGGDEFLVLLDDLSAGAELDDVVERITTSIGSPFKLGDHTVHVGVSIGTAECGPTTTVDQLLQEADRSMYRAKGAGRIAA